MDKIDFRIIQNIIIVLVTFIDIILVSDLVQRLFCPLADGIHVCLWVTLIYWNEFGSEPEPYDGDVILFTHII